jgi:tRNA pseudouridine38-40 synthase
MRYFIYLSYDGTNYHGWQIQPNANTIQAELMRGISTLLRQDIEVVGAGRTDTGVNASMMVAHFDTEVFLSNADLVELVRRLNRLLPPDIAIQRIVPVKEDAHARFSATARTYQYHVSSTKDPFNRHYTYRCPFPLDYDKMNEAAARLFDYTDFTSFSKLHTDTKTNNCRIMYARWENGIFTIKADRFLRNMVRAIVGTLMEVGRGAITIDDFCKIIEKKDRCAAGSSMPGNALFLTDIEYPEDIFKIEVQKV